MYYKTDYISPVGNLVLVCDDSNLIELRFSGQKYFDSGFISCALRDDEHRVLKKVKTWLNRYFDGENPDISQVPFLFTGTDFCRMVLEILCKIPYGTVITYGDIAKIIAAKQRNIPKVSARAVGFAVGHNPISIIVPCHRVVGKNGNLTGYAAGINTKIKLLKLENVDLNAFFPL